MNPRRIFSEFPQRQAGALFFGDSGAKNLFFTIRSIKQPAGWCKRKNASKYSHLDALAHKTTDDRRPTTDDWQSYGRVFIHFGKSGHTSPLKPDIILLWNMHLNRIIRIRVKGQDHPSIDRIGRDWIGWETAVRLSGLIQIRGCPALIHLAAHFKDYGGVGYRITIQWV